MRSRPILTGSTSWTHVSTWRCSSALEMHQRVAGHDTTLGAELQRLEVFAKCRQCVASGLDERGVQRAAGQRLDPECAGAGEGIEDTGTLDGVE